MYCTALYCTVLYSTLSCFSFCVLVFEGLYRSSLLGTLGSPEWEEGEGTSDNTVAT